MKIYLASGNAHKKQEMAAIFAGHTIVIPADEGIEFDPAETGSTFMENSLIKAKALWDLVKQPVLADDSGICVDILNGVPGVYSARYAGKDRHTGTPDGRKLPQEEQNRLLLEETAEAVAARLAGTALHKGIESELRACRYVCAMILFLGPDRFYAAQETMEGTLIPSLSESRGTGGFGYDPIVILNGYGKTVAELSAEEKNRVSHRGKAGAALRKLLDDYPRGIR